MRDLQSQARDHDYDMQSLKRDLESGIRGLREQIGSMQSEPSDVGSR